MIGINDKTIGEIEDLFKEKSYQKFRAKQVYRSIHVNRINDFDQMTDLPLKMREDLKSDFYFDKIKVLKTFESKMDSTKKYLLELADENIVEAVYMAYNDRSTICISSQVGCRMGCTFCASTKNGLVRNMTASELIEEVYLLERINGPISNIVIMGIGEPLDNFSNDAWTMASLLLSRALVASSRIRIGGFLRKTLAIDILCFCPPDNFTPRSPI